MTMAQPATEITLDLGARSYLIVVGAGVLSELGSRLHGLGFRGRVGLVTSAAVGRLWRDPAAHALAAAGFTPVLVTVPDGEEAKTLATVSAIWDALLAGGVDRRTPVVALGGGVVGDMTGFAAATMLRGVPVVQVPTTLLAQVDAAIGGKTGIDHAAGKNLIGAFHQPRLVLADVETLRTLPRRELLAGLAEVVKYGVIGDPGLFATIADRAGDVLALDGDVLQSVVAACAAQKAAVVSADEYEQSGQRAVLNFGHTVGHAVEAATAYGRLLHGEAVAIGMVAAARVSQAIGVCAADVPAQIRGVLERIGLPTEIPGDIVRTSLARHLQHDKKAAAGRIRFIAVETIGRTRQVELSVDEILNSL